MTSSTVTAPTAPETDSASPFSTVQKRDGKLVAWDGKRIIRAIALAMFEVKNPPKTPNPHRSDFGANYGLKDDDFDTARILAAGVERRLNERFGDSIAPSVEDVQNTIEIVVAEAGMINVVLAFMRYRTSQADKRPVKHLRNGMQEYLAVSKYCRYSETLGRREDWDEAVARVRDMHLRRFDPFLTIATPERVQEVIQKLLAEAIITPEGVKDAGGFVGLRDEIYRAYGMVTDKKVLPSMRSLQFGGAAIEQANARMFNCSFSPCNRREFFKEYFYLLLCGCGVGFSVQKHHVAMLPPLASRPDEIQLPVEHFVVPDTIEGWADSLDKLMDSYFNGYKVEFSYHLIRKRGSVLRTSGGRAPGHIPLKRALDKAETILKGAAGRHMSPIEVYDILMFTAKAVLSGGIRRSATICLFSHDDEAMMTAKSGNWFEQHEQRSASNNSAVLVRSEVTEEQFRRLFNCQKQFGEPGFYFTDNREVGSNPCVEIGLNPQLVVTAQTIKKLRGYGYTAPLNEGDNLYGFQMCNLSTMAGSAAKTPEDFFALARAASLIGTLQADYTDIPYLGPITRVLNEREALIGVSICGVLDNPQVLLSPDTLRRGAEVVKTTNAIVATLIGINRAARTTCVKPEGTSSLVLDCGSGIHPHHARRYIRHVQASQADMVYKWFKHHNPHMTTLSVYDANRATDVIMFPTEGPVNGIYNDDLTAETFLGYVKLVQENWVMPGRAHAIYSDVHHNVSNTVNVGPDEWEKVFRFIFDNRHAFTGVSLLTRQDKVYPQSPRMSLTNESDILLWNSLKYRPVNYKEIPDEKDVTAGVENRGAATACAGGACELT